MKKLTCRFGGFGKTRKTFGTALGLVFMLNVVHGESGNSLTEASVDSVQPRLGLLKQATKLFGRKVADRDGRGLGKIQDLLLDLPRGQVLAAYLPSGSGDLLIPLPAREFSSPSKNQLRITANKTLFKNTPQGLSLRPACVPNDQQLTELFAYFSPGSAKLPSQKPAGLALATGVVGAALHSESGELLGQVLDVMLDLPVGKVVYLVIELPASAETQADLYVIPPESVHRGKAGADLAIDLDRTGFLAGPHFERIYWSEMAFPELAAAVRKHYGLPSLLPAPGTPPTAASAAGDPNPGAPLGSAVVRTDQEITRAVVEEIIQDTKALAKLNVAVTTLNGRVTLSGSVKNESERRQILSATQRVVSPGQIQDRIETREKRKADGPKTAV